jgi:hypothetical protein
VKGAQVELELFGTRSTVSGPDGRFEFRGLSDATALYRLRTGRSPVVEVRPGGPLVRLELQPPNAIFY